MQKLNNDNVDKMIQAHLTKCEVSLMLYLSFYQDEHGRVYGVHYKAVCAATGMSYQEFYNAKKSLEEKGFTARNASRKV